MAVYVVWLPVLNLQDPETLQRNAFDRQFEAPAIYRESCCSHDTSVAVDRIVELSTDHLLIFGILIAAAARVAIPEEWFLTRRTASGLRAILSGAVAGTPLMLCSCCAAPLFEGIYGRTRRLETPLALMLAAPTLNPAALALTFILFPLSVTAARLALTAAALVGIAAIAKFIGEPTLEALEQPRPATERQSSVAAYASSILHVAFRTVPFVLIGIPVAILAFHQLRRIPWLGPSHSGAMLVLFVGAVLLLPLPTLFEIPLASSMLAVGAPLGVVVATLFVGPAINLPSLLVVGHSAGPKVSLFLALLIAGLAAATAFAFHS